MLYVIYIYMYIRSMDAYKQIQWSLFLCVNLRFENFKDFELKALS